MDVDAVVSVVIQKLTDMLIKEPVVFDKVIDQVEDIRVKLRRMRGYLIGAEENPPDDRVKKWADDYLRIIYKVEDIVETFALGLARRRQRWAFFSNYLDLFFFFNNLKACQKLRWKLARIRLKINNLNRRRPDIVRDLSFKYSNGCSESLDSNFDSVKDQEEEEEIAQGQTQWASSSSNPSEDEMLMSRYNRLPAHSKLCLLYLALFREEFKIPVRRLIRLWLAEGFVKRKPAKEPEDVALKYFKDLVKRKMLLITNLSSDGSPRRCQLPRALHRILLPKTKDIGLFHVHDKQDEPGFNGFEEKRSSGRDSCRIGSKGLYGLRRIIEYEDIKSYSDACSSELQNLRSYISFVAQKKDIPARDVARFVGKMTGDRGFALLRVLDLEGVYKPSLPDDLGDLFHLRYLGLRWTFLDNLPTSVGDLPYLETLDLKRTYINTLPNSIWKLKHLRHLNLNDIRLDMPRQPRCPLTQLLTLWGLFVDDKSRVKDGLNRLKDLRELGITFNLKNTQDLDHLADWISGLTTLQSLSLQSKDEIGRPSKLQWKPLSHLGKLSHLKLLGNLQLQKLPEIQEFPRNVKVLTLSVTGLKEDPMPTLGQLQSLSVLRLLADSFQGRRIVCPLRGFPKLKVLKLWMLKQLEEWEVKKGAMLNLKELNIRCCCKLRELPQCVLSTLENLTLTNMPQEFMAKVHQQKSKNTTLLVNEFEFSPLPWEEDEASGGVEDDPRAV